LPAQVYSQTTEDKPLPEIRLTIPLETPSQNTRDHQHWRARHRHRQQCEKAITAAWLHAGAPAKPPTGLHVELVVESYRWAQLDHANLVGGCKGLVDALVRQGFLTDDRVEYLTDAYTQTVDRKHRRTVITLTWS
jgi:hypothetical protein